MLRVTTVGAAAALVPFFSPLGWRVASLAAAPVETRRVRGCAGLQAGVCVLLQLVLAVRGRACALTPSERRACRKREGMVDGLGYTRGVRNDGCAPGWLSPKPHHTDSDDSHWLLGAP